MQPRGRRKGPTPAPLTQMPCSVGDGGSWVCGAVSVTEEKVQVTDEDKGTFIITDKGFSVVNTGVALGSSLGEAGAGGAAGGSVGGAAGGAHHHREDCTEKHCPSCIFLAMDAAKKAGKEERIGEGAQGTVYRFPGPEPRPRRGVQPTQYVRKEVSLDRCVRNNAPVSLREPSEDMENLIAAAIEGEFNRQYHQANNRHVVRMYCARLSMEDLPCAATLPASSSAPPSLATPASAGSALFDTSSLSSSSPSGAATPTSQPPPQPQPQRRRRRPRSVQFVMEYMDHNLSDVRRLAALVEQRILNRIVAKYPCRSSLSRRHKRAEACATVGGAAAAAGLAVVAHAWEACSHTLSYPSALYYRCHHPNTRRACSCGQGDESGTDPLPDALDNASSSSTPGVLPEAVLCAILLQLACALDKLNTLAILHKDIKPSNILLNREGVIKFSDFGTSKKGRYFTPSALGETPQPSIKRVVSTSSLCGDGSGIGSDLSMSMSFTPGLHRTASTSGSREFFAPKAGATTRLYMAPELCDTRSLLDGATGLGDAAAGMPASSPTEGTVGGSTDVWALGLSMLVLTTPHRSGPWPTEMLKDAFGLDSTPFCARSFRVNAALSPELREILCRCLLYKPTKRITPVEIRERLESLERSSGIHGGCPDRAGRCFCAGGGAAAAELAEAEAAAAEASSPLDGAGGLRCSPLPSFMACLLWLTQPKLEAERVRQQLQSIGLCAADEENTPADFSNWCTTTQRHLRKYFGTGPAAAAAAAAAEAAARPQQSAAAVAAAAAAAARVAAASSSSSASPPPSPPYAARRLISKPLQLSHSHTTAKVLHAAAATARPVRLEGAKPGWQRGGQRPVAALRCNQRTDVRAQFQWLVRNGNPAGTAAASAATPAAADGAEDATAAAPSLSVLGDRGFPPLSPALAARTRTSSASTTTSSSSSAAASTAGTSPVRAAAAASLPYRAPETPTQRFRSSRGGSGSGSGGNTPGSSGASTPAAAGSEAAAVQKLRRLHDMLEAREAFLERLERDLEQFYAEDIRQFHKEMVGELRYDAYVSPLLPDDEPAAGLSDSLFFDLFEHPEEAERLIQRRAELEHEKQDRRSAHKERRAVRVASQSQVDALADSLSERGYPQADQHGCGGSAAAAAQKGAGGGGGGGGGSGVAYQGPRRATKRQTAYHTEWAHV